jgi:hypothetical protein
MTDENEEFIKRLLEQLESVREELEREGVGEHVQANQQQQRLKWMSDKVGEIIRTVKTDRQLAQLVASNVAQLERIATALEAAVQRDRPDKGQKAAIWENVERLSTLLRRPKERGTNVVPVAETGGVPKFIHLKPQSSPPGREVSVIGENLGKTDQVEIEGVGEKPQVVRADTGEVRFLVPAATQAGVRALKLLDAAGLEVPLIDSQESPIKLELRVDPKPMPF